MDDDVTYQWKFMKVQTPAATENEPRYISLAYSINPQDLPTSLPDGCLLLYDGVVHCLPHDHSFSQPIILSFMLPESVNFSQITVMYSNTDIGHATTWRIMDNLVPGNESLHNCESSFFQNRAILLEERRELQLILRHFCIFAIMVDGKKEQAQDMAIDAYLRYAVSSRRYVVNVLVVVGCNADNCVSIIQFD